MLEFLKLTPATIPYDTYEITVEMDTNDGDYINNTTVLSPEELVEYLVPLILIAEGSIDRWGEQRTSAFYADNIEDMLSDLIPYGEYGGHDVTITSFTYTDKEGNIFDVDFDYKNAKALHPELFI